MRNQPIYDNKNLKNAGKYNFENVNSINKRIGEMEFDSSIKKDNSKYKQRVVVTSIISGVLLILTIVFAFTDIKYIFFPKKIVVEENKDFEDLDVLHDLSCFISMEQEGLKISIDKVYKYNNNKVKTAMYTYVIDISNDKLLSDASFDKYIRDSFDELMERYNNIEGLDITYSIEGSQYKLIQYSDLRVIDKNIVSNEYLDVHLDENIELIKQRQTSSGVKCK